MSILTASTGALVRLSVYKKHTNVQDKAFVNSYEFEVMDAAAIDTDSLKACVDAVVAFEKAIMFDFVLFDRAVLSTWADDTNPYNADEFISYDLTGRGSVEQGSKDPAPLNVVMHLRRVVRTGRPGKLHYRGCLAQENYHAPAGVIQAHDATQSWIETNIADAKVSSGIDGYMGDLPGPGTLKMVMAGINPQGELHVRFVKDLQFAGVAITQRNHRYFNRSS